jgi:hypothetical protein
VPLARERLLPEKILGQEDGGGKTSRRKNVVYMPQRNCEKET